jgi:hypothetical protein
MTRTTFFSVLALAAACGGKTIVDGKPGTGGAGGTSASTASAMGGTSSTVTPDGPAVGTSVGEVSVGTGPQTATVGPATTTVATATSTGTGMMSVCGPACMAASICSTQPQNCVAACDGLSCQPQHQQLLQCYLQNGLGKCNGSIPQCAMQLNAYLNCKGGLNGGCGIGSDGSCSCTDAFGNHKLESACTPGNAVSFCECKVDGMPIGKCTGPSNVKNACVLTTSCCAPLFLVAY